MSIFDAGLGSDIWQNFNRRRFMTPPFLTPEQSDEMGSSSPNPPLPQSTPPVNFNTTPPPSGGESPMTALQRYRQLLSQMPLMNQFEPTRARRITAALKSFSSDWMNPGSGEAAGQSILTSPYRRAMMKWQSQAQPIEALAKLEQEEALNKYRDVIAQARMKSAEAQGVSASAAQQRADALENKPVRPMEIKDIKGEDGKPHTFIYDYSTGSKKDIGEHLSTGYTFEQRKQIEKAKADAAMARTKVQAQSREKVAAGKAAKVYPPIRISPRDQNEAESMALKNILSDHPEYEQFLKTETDPKTKQTVVTGYDPVGKPSSFWAKIFGSSLEEVNKNKKDYQNFRKLLEQEKNKILSTSYNRSSSPPPNNQDEEDDFDLEELP